MKYFLVLCRPKIEEINRAIRNGGLILRFKVRSLHDESASAEDIALSVSGIWSHGEFHFLLGKGQVLSSYASHWIVIVGTKDEPVEVSQKAFTIPVNPGQTLDQVFHIIDNSIRKMVEPVV